MAERVASPSAQRENDLGASPRQTSFANRRTIAQVVSPVHPGACQTVWAQLRATFELHRATSVRATATEERSTKQQPRLYKIKAWPPTTRPWPGSNRSRCVLCSSRSSRTSARTSHLSHGRLVDLSSSSSSVQRWKPERRRAGRRVVYARRRRRDARGADGVPQGERHHHHPRGDLQLSGFKSPAGQRRRVRHRRARGAAQRGRRRIVGAAASITTTPVHTNGVLSGAARRQQRGTTHGRMSSWRRCRMGQRIRCARALSGGRAARQQGRERLEDRLGRRRGGRD